jgi:FAD/FMN-containing dehydrogenase
VRAPARRLFTSWGGLSARRSRALPAGEWLAPGSCREGPVLAYGNGRSYGDSCLLDGGALIDTSALSAIRHIDAASGVVECEPGALLGDIITTAMPLGWFLPVTPGTRFVTIAGALANDVHGKNHHGAGTFGRHVLWFDLARSDGAMLRCSAQENTELFAATVGGLGLTGLITRVALQMLKVRGPFMQQDVLPFASLDGFFDLAARSDASHDYTVAWIDSLATGSALGRGVFFRANHADEPGTLGPARMLPFLPFTPPFALINRLTLSAFNAAYRTANGQAQSGRIVPLMPFFYPLDAVKGWNRAYGPRGLRQFQCVVPMTNAREAVAAMLRATHQAGEASFLTVLKLFGDLASPGLLSFPMPGATLTLDFPYRGARTDALLVELDRITLDAAGRVNPYKDARMSATTFEASFPQWRAFARHVDPAFSSSFWRRVAG